MYFTTITTTVNTFLSNLNLTERFHMVKLTYMRTKYEMAIISDFFLDGAKLIFASLVVGIFVPGAAGKIPWLTFTVGVGMTILFLSIAVKLSKIEAQKQ